METSNSQFQLDIWVRISNMNHKQRKPLKLKAGGLKLSVAKRGHQQLGLFAWENLETLLFF